ncbi:hypothetical protein [Flavobacterium sp. H122]|uniref:hypothetical protein n=1 Tax=Flavobacterium sp. H122 TaxID=2529860 RepID=UPI0010AB1379|nr:hypothetical protein [Flavobacterium sp. H122]
MKNRFLLLFFLLSSLAFSQDTSLYGSTLQDSIKPKYERTRPISPVFKQFEITTSLSINDEDDDPYTEEDESKPLFIPNSLGVKYGFGLQKNKWLGISFNTGIDIRLKQKLVAVPLFANLRLSPFFRDEQGRLVINLGYGRGYAIGRGDMQGRYRRINLSFEGPENIGLLVELSDYGFHFNNKPSNVLFSLGVYGRLF